MDITFAGILGLILIQAKDIKFTTDLASGWLFLKITSKILKFLKPLAGRKKSSRGPHFAHPYLEDGPSLNINLILTTIL